MRSVHALSVFAKLLKTEERLFGCYEFFFLLSDHCPPSASKLICHILKNSSMICTPRKSKKIISKDFFRINACIADGTIASGSEQKRAFLSWSAGKVRGEIKGNVCSESKQCIPCKSHGWTTFDPPRVGNFQRDASNLRQYTPRNVFVLWPLIVQWMSKHRLHFGAFFVAKCPAPPQRAFPVSQAHGQCGSMWNNGMWCTDHNRWAWTAAAEVFSGATSWLRIQWSGVARMILTNPDACCVGVWAEHLQAEIENETFSWLQQQPPPLSAGSCAASAAKIEDQPAGRRPRRMPAE